MSSMAYLYSAYTARATPCCTSAREAAEQQDKNGTQQRFYDSQDATTASLHMVPPAGTIWTANKKFGGAVLGSGLEGGSVFRFGH